MMDLEANREPPTSHYSFLFLIFSYFASNFDPIEHIQNQGDTQNVLKESQYTNKKLDCGG